MTTYNILCLLGIPTLVAGGFEYLFGCVKAVRLGVQALLRAQLIEDYNYYKHKGYAPIYARENFINVWTQYHALGKNGVMNDLKDRFLSLPIQSEEEEYESETS